MFRSPPRFAILSAAAVLVAATVLVLFWTARGRPDAAPVPKTSPPSVHVDSGGGVWTAARKRDALRRCESRFAGAPDELKHCLRRIPLDGDWAALGPS